MTTQITSQGIAGSGVSVGPDGKISTAFTTETLDTMLGIAPGTLAVRGLAGWYGLPPGSAGQFLTTQGGSSPPSWTAATTVVNSAALDGSFGSTQGALLYRNASVWTMLAPGNAGQLLASGGAAANPSWTAPPLQNKIMNSGMQVSQRNGTTAVTVTGSYPADCFVVGASNAGAFSCAQVASATPGGSPNRLRFTVTTADAAVGAGDVAYLLQHIEGRRIADAMLGTASAKTLALRFGVKGPAGTYCVAFRNAAANRSCVVEYVISAGEANTDTVKTVVINGDAAGTWLTDNGIGLSVFWTLMAGTTYQGVNGGWTAGNFFGTPSQSNFMGTNGNVFELFDVGLYVASSAPTWQLPDFADELRKCMRYWEKSMDYAIGNPASMGLIAAEGASITGVAASTHQVVVPTKFKVPKRASATVNVYSPGSGANAKLYDIVLGGDITANVDNNGETGFRAYGTTASSTTYGVYFHWTADASL
jgi:hypothetical protein